MKLFDTIDGLLIGTRYLTWGIAVVGTLASLVLLVANVPLGIGSAAACVALFLLACAVVLLLLPKKLAAGGLEGGSRFAIGGLVLLVACAVMGIVYLACGGFPPLNLVFA